MMPLSVTGLIARISDAAGSLGRQLVRDLESVALPVSFLIFDPAREELGITLPAAYFFTSARHLIALSDEVASGPDLTIIAHEIGHARLFEAGYPLCTVAMGLTGEEAWFCRHLAAVLPTALQDPVVNALLSREGYPVEASYVRLLAPDTCADSSSENEALRAVYALSVYAHLRVFEGNSRLQEYWDACVDHDAGVAEVVAGLLPSAPSSMTPDAMHRAIARFSERYDPNRRLSTVSLPLLASVRVPPSVRNRGPIPCPDNGA